MSQTLQETYENSENYSYYDAIYFDITEFLTEYEKLPCLWDRTHVLFKNRESRAKAEEILSQKLGIMDSKTLRRKIRSVRGTYNTEIRKVKISLESGSDVYVPKLSWFHLADSFLRVTTDLSSDVVFQLDSDESVNTPKKLLQKLPRQKGVTIVMLRKTKNDKNYMNSDENDEVYANEEFMKEDILNDDIMDYVDPNIDTNKRNKDKVQINDQIFAMDDQIQDIDSVNDCIDIQPHELEDSDGSRSPDFKKRKRNSAHRGSKTDTVAKYLKELIQSTENEFLTFGRSIGMQLQKLPLELALQLQMDIQTHITKSRLDFLQNNPESSS